MNTEVYSFDSEKFCPIESVEFSLLGNAEIRNMSALGDAGVIYSDLYNSLEPKPNGLIDPHMGTTDNTIDCQRCGLNSKYCVGHFGHINLAEPVFHIGFLKAYVRKILSCVCLKCSKLLVYKNEEEIIDILKNKSGKARLSEIKNLVKNVSQCQEQYGGCGTVVPKIRLDIKKSTAAMHILLETNLTNLPQDEVGTAVHPSKNKITYLLTADMCYNILANISDNDCIIMGLNPKLCRPEQLIHRTFPVPPVQIRPSTRADFLASSIMANDLTVKLSEIIKANTRIIEHRESVTENNVNYGKDIVNLLQYHVATYFDNESSTLLKSEKGREIRSVSYRLKGKSGRIRDNLMGKRVDFSARTVITSDPSLDINQLGIPIKIAMNATFPEIVTPHNIEHLTKLVRNGTDIYPGANSVFPARMLIPGQSIQPNDLRFGKDSVELRYGDIVERHLVDGDIVLLNRQPTLHKQSMMGHYIKVINNSRLKTFRLAVAVTTPYNADFDGDEMNIFLSQSIQTQIELEDIADVKRQIITPSSSQNIIGIVQDGLLGAYNLTSPTMRVDWKNSMNIMSYTNIDDFKVFKKNTNYSGHELFSMIIPNKINVSRYNGDKPLIVIKNGTFIDGVLNKSLLGPKQKNNLIKLIWDEYGVVETKDFLDNTQKLVNNFNLYNGFTISIKDIAPVQHIADEINKIFDNKDIKVSHMITEMENNPNLMDTALFERTLQAELNVVQDDVSKLIMSNVTPDNNLGIMVTSGSKGSTTNLGQMCGCVGLRAVEGKLIAKKINDRTLPYFFENDDTSVARGLVKQSYLKGVGFSEYIFDAIASREGAIDTALKTAESGYAQRKLVKMMEDTIIKYDGTVRSANNTILQYIYGDSGADTTKQYDYLIKLIDMSNTEIREKLILSDSELKKVKNYSKQDNDDYYNELINMRNLLRTTQIKSRLNYITLNSNFMLPVNLQRIVDNNKNDATLELNNEPLQPSYIISEINKALNCSNTMLLCMLNKDKTDEKSIKYIDDSTAKTALRIAMLELLSPKNCLFVHNLNKAKFDAIISNIISNFNKNIVEPGVMVGIISAQSMGECLTQMSCAYDSKIIILNKTTNEWFDGDIGKYIDDMLNNNISNVKQVPDHPDSVVFDITDDLYVVSVSSKEKTQWSKISQISKHPANGQLMKVTTESGRTVTTTTSHSYLQRTTNSITSIEGSKLVIGDRIPVACYIECPNTLQYYKSIQLTNELGNLVGVFLTNKNNTINILHVPTIALDNILEIHKSNMNMTNVTNTDVDYIVKINIQNYDIETILQTFINEQNEIYIANYTFVSNNEFIYGLLNGYCKINYGIMFTRDSEFIGITINAHSKLIFDSIIMLLNYIGVYGVIDNNYEYHYIICSDYLNKFLSVVDLKISESYLKNPIKKFHDIIPNVNNTIKQIYETLNMNIPIETDISRSDLYTHISNINIQTNNCNLDCDLVNELQQAYESDVIWDKIINIEYFDGDNAKVYDLTVPGNQNFMINNGVLVHNTLNTFHTAGLSAIASTTSGIPRIKELLSMTKKIKTPQMILYINKEHMTNRDIANKIVSHVNYITLKSLRNNLEVRYDPNPMKKGGYRDVDKVIDTFYNHTQGKNGCQSDIESLPWLIRIFMNREKMLENEITLLDIKSRFCNTWEKRYNDIKSIKKEEKAILDKVLQCSISSNSNNDDEPILHIRFDMVDVNYSLINDFIDMFIEKFKLKGISNINDGVINEERVLTFDGANQAKENKLNYAIYTTGINLYDIRYMPYIDLNKTICNDVLKIYQAFGIEAARAVLIREITIAYERSGNFVNVQHLSILADTIALYGFMVSVDRHGMTKSSNDPLSKASFENTVDHFITAAMFNESDNMAGVSARIMAGMVIKSGTGMCDLLLDTDMLEQSEFTEDISQKYIKTYNEINTSSDIQDIINKNTDEMFIPM